MIPATRSTPLNRAHRLLTPMARTPGRSAQVVQPAAAVFSQRPDVHQIRTLDLVELSQLREDLRRNVLVETHYRQRTATAATTRQMNLRDVDAGVAQDRAELADDAGDVAVADHEDRSLGLEFERVGIETHDPRVTIVKKGARHLDRRCDR